jgi:hypothetical protein
MPEDQNGDPPQVWTEDHEKKLAAMGRTSRAATASLVLGILSLLCLGPFAAVPGLVLALIGFRNTGWRGKPGRGRAWLGLGLCAGCLALWAGVIFKPAWRARAMLEFENLRARVAEMTEPEGAGVERNERRALVALRRLRAVQEKRKVKFGTYARSAAALLTDDPGCRPIVTAHTRRKPYHGYYFVSISRKGSGFVNHSKDFLIVAFPAKHGKSGKRTLAIGPTGPVRAQDLGGATEEDAEKILKWPPAK